MDLTISDLLHISAKYCPDERIGSTATGKTRKSTAGFPQSCRSNKFDRLRHSARFGRIFYSLPADENDPSRMLIRHD